jgi:hypothetical protein
MWSWFNCYLSGRHEYGVWCEPGSIFLRCVHCGRRSSGWTLDATAPTRARERAGGPKAAGSKDRRSRIRLHRAEAR